MKEIWLFKNSKHKNVYLMVSPSLTTAKQLAMIPPLSSSQNLIGSLSLVPGKLPLALFIALALEHLAVNMLSSCMRNTFIPIVVIFLQYLSHENALFIFVHLECWQLKKPFNFMLSFSLSIIIPSALWWQSISSLILAQWPKLQLNTPVRELHSLPLLQLYLLSCAVFTCGS